MSIKDYFVKQCGISEARFDEFAELACQLEDAGVPICAQLRCSAWFELLVAYGRANRERRKEN